MLAFKIKLTVAQREQLVEMLKIAQTVGKMQQALRVLAILAFAAEQPQTVATVATILQVSPEAVRQWVSRFLARGPAGLTVKKRAGRRPRLTKTQKRELYRTIVAGPHKAGFPGACWRSPMIQELIYRKYKVSYSVYYLAQFLKNLGLSYQKARFMAKDADPKKRTEWIESTWPAILKLARGKNAYLLFGDEASFPQWGTLTYTWAPRGQQPVVQTSGKRKGYKVFGLVDYFTGRFFYKCTQDRLTSASYQEFLTEVLRKTRKHLILVQDGAKYHTSKAMREFFARHAQRLTVFDLPSYSPDYNPIERLWKKIKQEETHMHYFPTFESLMNKVEEAMLHFTNAPEKVLSLFVFYDELVAA
jgi:transposase